MKKKTKILNSKHINKYVYWKDGIENYKWGLGDGSVDKIPVPGIRTQFRSSAPTEEAGHAFTCL